MTVDLTKITGIGSNSAKALAEAGFETFESVAKSSPEVLGKVSGFGPKRAAKIIASAKELVADAKPAPVAVVAPVVVTTAKPSKPAVTTAKPVVTTVKPGKPAATAAKSSKPVARKRGRTFFAAAAAVLLMLAAVVFFAYQNNYWGMTASQTAHQDSAKAAPGQKASNHGQKAMNNPAIAAQGTTAPEQRPMNGPGQQQWNAMPRQGNVPEWVSRQRAEATARSEMHRAQAERIQEESWRRYIASLPPAQAAQVIRQHEMAMQHMQESQRRQAAMIQQHNAYMNQRYGG